MANLIKLSTPERYRVKGIAFQDFTLDIDSLRGNCAILARELGQSASPTWVMEKTKSVIIELGDIVKGHSAGREPA